MTQVEKFSAVELDKVFAVFAEYETISAVKADKPRVCERLSLSTDDYKILLKAYRDHITEPVRDAVTRCKDSLKYEDFLSFAFSKVKECKEFDELCAHVEAHYTNASAFVRDYYSYMEGDEPLTLSKKVSVDGKYFVQTFESKGLTATAAISVIKSALGNLGRGIIAHMDGKNGFDNRHKRGEIAGYYKAERNEMGALVCGKTPLTGAARAKAAESKFITLSEYKNALVAKAEDCKTSKKSAKKSAKKTSKKSAK